MKTALWKEYKEEYKKALNDKNAIIWRRVYLLGMLTEKQAKELYQILWDGGCQEIHRKGKTTYIEFPSGGVGLNKIWEEA